MNKGFTLIELLAVIIILSLLTVIVVTSVNPLVKDSKKELTDIQINNIEEAAKLYYIKFGMDIADIELSGPRDCIEISELIESGYIDRDEINNPKNNEEITGSVKVTYKANNYIYEYQNNACTNYDKGIICERVTSTSVGNVPEGNFEAGDAYTCKVDPDKEPYTFYVLTTAEKDSETVNLIMDSNININGEAVNSNAVEDKGLVAWINEIDYVYAGGTQWTIGASFFDQNMFGPVTAMNHLYNATKDWTNVPNIQMNYTDERNTGSYGYGKIVTIDNITKITKKDGTPVPVLTNQEGYPNLKARLPYGSELSNWDSINKTNTYLYNYLEYGGIQTNSISGIFGYWTSSAVGANSEAALLVYQNGDVIKNFNVHDIVGVRPVITVYKSQME